MKNLIAFKFTVSAAITLLFFTLLFNFFEIKISGYSIKFSPPFSSHVSASDSIENFNISDSLLTQAQNLSAQNKLRIYSEEINTNLKWYIDSLIKESELPIVDSLIKESPYLINLPINGKYPLDAFFEALEKAKNGNGKVRAGHYGDSQIEGDRVTNDIRTFFQKRFGGKSIGFIPIDDVTQPVSFTRSVSGHWQRHTVAKNVIENNRFGPGGCAFTYNGDSVSPYMTIQFYGSYDELKLGYGHGKANSKVKIIDAQTGKIISEHVLSEESSFNLVNITNGQYYPKVKLVFYGSSPVIYGLWADDKNGLEMDNYGLRGQAGDGLLRISAPRLKDMYDKLDFKLAITQFGGNVIPVIRNTNLLNTYGEIYKKLYLHLQASMTDGSSLVLSINDLSRSVGGKYKSFDFISEMRYLQRKSAIENGLAFFDLYQFMGGKESIQVWSAAGLAAKDGHFNDKGRKILSCELFKAILFEYNQYIKRKAKK